MKTLALTKPANSAKPLSRADIISALVERERQQREQAKREHMETGVRLKREMEEAAHELLIKSISRFKIDVRRGFSGRLTVEIDIARSTPGFPTKQADALDKHEEARPDNFDEKKERDRLIKLMNAERTNAILTDKKACEALDSILNRLKSVAV